MEKYSSYEFEIYKEQIPVWSDDGDTGNKVDGYLYKIYYWHDYCQCTDYIQSDEWYKTDQQAYEAVIEHIDRLENGES